MTLPMLPRLAALLILFPICVFVPGFVALRRFELPDELRLPAAVGVSLLLLYLSGLALYVLDAGAPLHLAIVASVLAVGVWRRRELGAFVRSPGARAMFLHHALFAAWLLLLILVVRNYSGGAWSGDWVEHYQRAVFFCGALPLDTQFIGLWPLTARPPLDNVVAAFFMKMLGTEFAAYQLVSVLLGSLQFLGAASLWFALSDGRSARRHTGLLVLTALLALNPSVVQNATYPWTRALTNFFVLQGAAFFIASIRRGDPAMRRWSYLHLGLGVVTHYSTIPYVVALGLIELYLLVRRRLSLRDLLLAGAWMAAPILPWLAFALGHFGLAGTFGSNSTVAWNAALTRAELAARVAGNLVTSMVPHPLRDVTPLYDQPYLPGRVRDYAFLIYQVTLPGLLGSAGAVATAVLISRRVVSALRGARLEPVFLAALFVATTYILGIATVADDDAFGAAHVCLQPLAVGALVVLATRFEESGPLLRSAFGLGLLLDAFLGITLHFWVESLSLPDLAAIDPDVLPVSRFLAGNLQAKIEAGYVFLADLPESTFAQALSLIAFAALLTLALRAALRERHRLATP